MSTICIVSPSNKFYGSEQVLFDFLKTTKNKYNIYVKRGKFYDILIKQNKHIIHSYKNVNALYVKLAFLMLFNKYDGIYINEGGHSRYITLLSKLFPNRRFFIHIRLLEDTKFKRLGEGRRNIKYISISQYITDEVFRNTGIMCQTIHDLYVPTQNHIFRKVQFGDVIKAGIVGRVTDTKGMPDIIKFCDYVESLPAVDKKLELHFFGAINEDSPLVSKFVEKSANFKNIHCVFHGFVDNKTQIYGMGGVTNLLHFNKIEPLGRIFFEAVDYCIPVIGFASGGIGEIAHLINMYSFVVSPKCKDWESKFLSIIMGLPNNWTSEVYHYACCIMNKEFSPKSYTVSLEKFFDEV